MGNFSDELKISIAVAPNAIDTASFAYDPEARAEARAELGFSDGMTAWAQAVLSEPTASRISRVDDVRAHGFDVKENVERLQDWYLREAAVHGR